MKSNHRQKIFESQRGRLGRGVQRGNSAAPERNQNEDSPAALLVQSRVPQKSFLFLLEKIRRAQIEKSKENFFAEQREKRAAGAERQFRSKKVRAFSNKGHHVGKVKEFMNPEQQKIIEKVADEVKQKLEGEGSGHDWWHIIRVWNMAKHIGTNEGADMFVVELAALLHDIADWKFHDGDDTVGPKMARHVLEKHSVSTEVINQVCDIIMSMSFKGAGVKTEMKMLEGKIVQDSDRLDAIGAIGVARTFAYGGHKNRPMYDPNKKPSMHQSKEEYFKNESPTINHFYEKLLLLKDRMNTKTAKELAEGRHRFMEQYLDRFFQEWDGKN